MFETWEAASDAAVLQSQETAQAFETGRWLDRQQSMLHSARKGISTRFTYLPLFLAVTGTRTVLDLGGGSGWTFELIAHGNTAALDTYIVVEQKISVEYFSLNFLADDRIDFIPSEQIRDQQLDSVGVLYSNSALQYFPDNGFLTQLIVACAPDWILLDDIQSAVKGDFFSMQHYYGLEIPCRFCDVNLLIEEVQRLGYALKVNMDYPASIRGVLKPTLGGKAGTQHDIGAPRSLLFEAI